MEPADKCRCAVNDTEKALIEAVENSDTETASELLGTKGEDRVCVNIKSGNGFPIITIAAKNNDVRMTGLLLEHDPDLSVTDCYGRCALVWGIMNRNQDLYIRILKKHGDLNTPDNILVSAIAYGEFQCAEYILRFINNVNLGWIAGRNPLMWAAELNSDRLVSDILMKGPNISDVSITDSSNMGDPKTEKFMMELVRGDDPESRKAKELKYTKKINIYKSCESNRMVKAYKAMFDILAERDYGRDVIKERITDMLQAGLKIDVRNSLGRTPFSLICSNERGKLYFEDDKAIVNLFSAAGADINAPDCDLSTPLHYAVLEQYMNMINILLKKGADPLLKNSSGYSARDLAVIMYPYNPDIIKAIDGAGIK